MLVFFGLYLFGKTWAALTGTTLRMFQSNIEEQHPWWLPQWVDFPMQIAMGWCLYLAGSGIRAWWSWGYLHCLNTGEWCWLKGWGEILWLAIICGVLGMMCIIRIYSPPEWRPWSWVISATLAITVPVLVYSI